MSPKLWKSIQPIVGQANFCISPLHFQFFHVISKPGRGSKVKGKKGVGEGDTTACHPYM